MLDVLEFSQFENTGNESNKIVCQQHKAPIQISPASSRGQVVKRRANGLLENRLCPRSPGPDFIDPRRFLSVTLGTLDSIIRTYEGLY